MTYARARLWLGISGVGTTVTVATLMLWWQIPEKILPTSESWSLDDVAALGAFLLGFVALMLPFDLLGGYLLPRRFRGETLGFSAFVRGWLVGVVVQSILFVLSGLAILQAGRAAGLIGALCVIAASGLAYLAFQSSLARFVAGHALRRDETTVGDLDQPPELRDRNSVNLVVLDHMDSGFTGGLVGLPGRETNIVPRKWVELLSKDELRTAIVRRSEALTSGSRVRGLILAFAWILCGFTLSAFLPGAGVRSVAELVTTCCGFTCWMFIGLLILPTISRRASFAIDQQVVERGIPTDLLGRTLAKLDQIQDDEPTRAPWIERIFHPVPSLQRRRQVSHNFPISFTAWHAARITLFLSWSCLGLLSRAVHCNAGRPELWVLLPTD